MLKLPKDKKPFISIIIPSFNKGKYIKQTLESIVAQNYPNLEVIIQDGGSTDQTVDIVKKFASKYEYIKWESKKDKGQLGAINEGMKKARGDILTYINADDFYEKDALHEVARVFAGCPKALWFAGRGRVVDGLGREIAKPVTQFKNLLLKINNYTLLLVVNYLMQPSVFISKRAFRKYGPFKGTPGFVMEYDLWLKLGKVKMPQITDKYLSVFRIAYGSITSTSSKFLLLEDIKVLKKNTRNPLILLLHKMGNWGRLLLIRFNI